jgi:hypothetical protein
VGGELAGDRDGDDCASFAAPLKIPPALVKPAGDRFGLCADGGRLTGASPSQRDARP